MDHRWPLFSGDYELGSSESPVAIVVIGRGMVELPKDQYSIIGSLKTENMGIEKIVANVISNPGIRFVVICGREEFGHFPAEAMLALHMHGVDEKGRIRCKRSAVPFLCNLPLKAVERFRDQVQVVDLVYPKDAEEIVAFDPLYRFDEERRRGLQEVTMKLNDCDPGPYPQEPMVLDIPNLGLESGKIAKDLNKLADEYASQMLRLPSEKLSTSSSLVVVSTEFNLIIDPVDGQLSLAPSYGLAARLKSYLRGE